MSKYSLYATKQDYADAFKTLEGLEKQSGEKFDWKKIKRTSLDGLATLIGILKRKLPAPATEQWVFVYRRSSVTGNYYIYGGFIRDGVESIYSTGFSSHSTEESVNSAINNLITNGCYGIYKNIGFQDADVPVL